MLVQKFPLPDLYVATSENLIAYLLNNLHEWNDSILFQANHQRKNIFSSSFDFFLIFFSKEYTYD